MDSLDLILAKKYTCEKKNADTIYEKYLYIKSLSDSSDYNFKFTSNPSVANFHLMNHDNRRKFCRYLESFNMKLLENGIVKEFNSYTDFMNDPDLRESFGNSIIIVQLSGIKDTTEITINPETKKVLLNTFFTSDIDNFPLTKLNDNMECIPITWL
jgi:hypothetical protein